MEWARLAGEGAVKEAAPKVTDQKDETRTAKRVRRREQQKVAQQRYRCANDSPWHRSLSLARGSSKHTERWTALPMRHTHGFIHIGRSWTIDWTQCHHRDPHTALDIHHDGLHMCCVALSASFAGMMPYSGTRRQKQRHWAAEMEVKVDELARLHAAIQAERATLAARRALLEVRVTCSASNLQLPEPSLVSCNVG